MPRQSRPKTTARAPRGMAQGSRPANLPKPKKASGKKKSSVLRPSNQTIDLGYQVPHREVVMPGPDIVIHHSEPLLPVDASQVTTGPTSLMPLSPSSLTWAAPLATRFELYQFTDITLEYKASCPVTSEGVVRFRYEPDSEDEPMGGAAFLASGMTLVTPAWETKKLSLRPIEYQEVLWKHTSDMRYGRLESYGRLHKWISGVTTTVGQLWIHYKLAFRTPQIEGGLPTTATTYDSGGAEVTKLLTDATYKWYGVAEGTKLVDRLNRVVAEAKYVTDNPAVRPDLPSFVFNRIFKGLVTAKVEDAVGDIDLQGLNHTIIKQHDPDPGDKSYYTADGDVACRSFNIDAVPGDPLQIVGKTPIANPDHLPSRAWIAANSWSNPKAGWNFDHPEL